MPEPIPQKIQMIKEVREMTGLGLGHAKQLIDALCREGGPVSRMITEVQLHNDTAYEGGPSLSRLPDLSAAPRGTVGTPYYAKTESFDTTGSAGDLEERVARIENWIRAEADR